MIYNATLLFEIAWTNYLIGMFGSIELLAMVAYLVFVIILFLLNLPTDVRMAIALFIAGMVTAPTSIGGFGLFPDGNLYFILTIIIAGLIVARTIYGAIEQK